MKNIYLILSIIGILLPYYFATLIVLETGTFDVIVFLEEALSNNSSRFIASDLGVTALTAMLYIIYQGKKNKIKYWWVSILGVFLVGVSFALPFFLYLQEKQKSSSTQSQNS